MESLECPHCGGLCDEHHIYHFVKKDSQARPPFASASDRVLKRHCSKVVETRPSNSPLSGSTLEWSSSKDQGARPSTSPTPEHVFDWHTLKHTSRPETHLYRDRVGKMISQAEWHRRFGDGEFEDPKMVRPDVALQRDGIIFQPMVKYPRFDKDSDDRYKAFLSGPPKPKTKVAGKVASGAQLEDDDFIGIRTRASRRKSGVAEQLNAQTVGKDSSIHLDVWTNRDSISGCDKQ